MLIELQPDLIIIEKGVHGVDVKELLGSWELRHEVKAGRCSGVLVITDSTVEIYNDTDLKHNDPVTVECISRPFARKELISKVCEIIGKH